MKMNLYIKLFPADEWRATSEKRELTIGNFSNKRASIQFLHYLLGNKPFGITSFE